MDKIKTSILLMTFLAFCTLVAIEIALSIPGGLRRCEADDLLPPSNTTIAQDQEKKGGAPEKSESLKVHIDPKTGELRVPTKDEVPALERVEPDASFSTSHEGLVESPSPVPGGGVMIDLKGRFHNPLKATIDGNGKIKISH